MDDYAGLASLAARATAMQSLPVRPPPPEGALRAVCRASSAPQLISLLFPLPPTLPSQSATREEVRSLHEEVKAEEARAGPDACVLAAYYYWLFCPDDAWKARTPPRRTSARPLSPWRGPLTRTPDRKSVV